ncbi:MAG: protein phosphatase 2C domain-containing protein [Pseudomonadota bacterium]
MKEPTTLVPEFSASSLSYRGAGMTHAGRVREENEDSILTDPTDVFWAIADGMGGYGHGQTASEIVIDWLSRMQDDGDVRGQLDTLLVAANRDIQVRAHELGSERIGATVIALKLDKSWGHIAWVGDCRAYVCREGRLQQLTRDHTVVEELVRDGLLEPENARGHVNANVVTRAVGAEPVLDVEHRTVPLFTEDRIILCSDGLTTSLEDADILGHVAAAPDPEAAARFLLADALAKGAPDNVSVIVIFAEGSEP